MRGLRLRIRDARVLPGAIAGKSSSVRADGSRQSMIAKKPAPGRDRGRLPVPGKDHALQENGRFGGGGGLLMPITRPPASIALPGRSITQFTVLPVALAAPPTIEETAENTPRCGGASAVTGGCAGPATTGPAAGVAGV